MPITFNSQGGFLNGTISSSDGNLFITTNNSAGQLTIGNLRLTGSIVEQLDKDGVVRKKETFNDNGTVQIQEFSPTSKIQSTTIKNPASGLETIQSASATSNQILFNQGGSSAAIILSGSDPRFSIQRTAGANGWQSSRKAQRNFFLSGSVKFAHGLSSEGDYYFSPADSAAGIIDAVKFENNPPFFMISQSGDVVIRGGKLIAESYEVSSSVTNMQIQTNSGSTKFGDTLDDTHQFTGSVFITGSSLEVDGNIAIDGTEVFFPSGIISASKIKTTPTFDIEVDGLLMARFQESPSADIIKIGQSGVDIDTSFPTLNSDHTLTINGGTDKVGVGLSNPDSKLQIAGDLTVDSHITASGNISSSGTITMLTASIGGGIFTSASLAAGGSGGGDVSLGDNVNFGHITASGNISASGDLFKTKFIQMTNSSSVIDTFNTGSFRSAKYTLQVTSASNYQVSEMLVLHDDGTVLNTEYAQINSGLNLIDFTTDVNDSNVRLNAAGSFISCSVRLDRTIIPT